MMKDKLITFLSLIVIISLNSCSKESNIDDQTTTSISITTAQADKNLGETYTFTVTDNNGNTLQSGLIFYANNLPISGSAFTPSEEGNYSVYAKYKSLSSNTLSLVVTKLPSTSISIIANETQSPLGENIIFSIRDNNGVDVTTESTIYVNDDVISGSSFTPLRKGTFEAYAVYEDLESSKEFISIYHYTQKILIEDYTGTWCGWCPRVANAIELVLQESSNVIPVGIHCGNDPFDFAYKQTLLSEFGIEGFPTAKINRNETWSYPENTISGINQVLGKLETKSPLGIGINSTTTAGNLNINVEVSFGKDLSGLKLIVYILEDNLHANQANYTSLYGGQSNLINFEHDHVLRHCITDLLGEEIPSSESKGSNTFNWSYSFEISSSDVSDSSNLKIVAFVIDGPSNSTINVQKSSINETIDF